MDFLPNEDNQKYYRWESYGPEDRRTEELWINLSASQIRIHGILSNTHRQAATNYYSFIFMGEVIHQMLTATQYVAPLMANFDPSFSSNSTVRYSDNGNLFVVQWDKVRLKDRESEGAFTFQTVLHKNGTIVFNYREIPILVEKMNSTDHPVKVGLSDAFLALMPSSLNSGSTQHTIYEYHRVEIDPTKIVNRSAIEIIPLPTCSHHTTCELCTMSNLTTGCAWCNTVQSYNNESSQARRPPIHHRQGPMLPLGVFILA
uniref:Plexin domain containing 1 n=1 Tax=Periophthalmus magnuspinnatus TaxID=409849 RepID=A0A3B4AMG5_9GOBI